MLIMQRCLENFEGNRFLFTDEKHRLIRVCTVCLFLMDDSKFKLGNLKKFTITNYMKIFRVKKI
jgi:hypothetical protein